MLIGEPTKTEFDLRFRLAQYPVRVTPWFWLVAVLLSPRNADGFPGAPELLLPWIAAVFTSVLIHELGHAVAFAAQGIPSHIVLYQFGGLAIPTGAATTGGGRDPRSRMVVSAAGPAAQLTSAAILLALVLLSGRSIPPIGLVGDWLPLPAERPFVAPPTLLLFVLFYLEVSIYWALLNLLPVYPLDGGQIVREAFLLFDRSDPLKHSLILSVMTGGLLALWGFYLGQTFLGILFGMLAYSSYTTLQSLMGGGGGYGRRW